ncbi:ribonuclease H-like domain-containing protein [Tanacetum coccineum]
MQSTDYHNLTWYLKRILRYVRGTLYYGLQLFSSSTTDLVAYLDADGLVVLLLDAPSGYCVILGNNLVSWSSKRQLTLSRSSVEVEYRDVANVVAETCWLRNLLRELHTSLSSVTLVYYDNISVVYLSCNPVQHQCTKHIEIDIHFVRDLVAAGQVRVLHVPSRYQFADIFTKSPDNHWGETPCAFVKVKEGYKLSADELIAFFIINLPHYMAPRTVAFEELPKTSTGKTQKFVLREKAKEMGSLSSKGESKLWKTKMRIE